MMINKVVIGFGMMSNSARSSSSSLLFFVFSIWYVCVCDHVDFFMRVFYERGTGVNKYDMIVMQ